MISLDPRSRWIDAQEGEVREVQVSINNPFVAVPGHDSQPTQAVLVTIEKGPGRFSVAVFLHLKQEEAGAVFRPELADVPAEALAQVRAEAVAFVESMGFLMDDTAFARKSPAERHEIFASSPAFHPPVPKAAVEAAGPAVVEVAGGSAAPPSAPSLARAADVPPPRGTSGLWVRLLAALCVPLVLGTLAGCAGNEQEIRQRQFAVYQAEGIENLRRGNLEQAFLSFKRAEGLVSDNAELFNELGLTELGMGKAAQAIEDFNRALDLKEEYPEAYNNRGVVYLQMLKLDPAIADFRKALAFEEGKNGVVYATPENAWTNLGYAQYQKGDLKGAKEAVRRALSRNPRFSQAHYILGLVEAKDLDWEPARASFEKAIQLQPGYVDAHYNLGLALWKLKRTDEARRELEQVCKIAPGRDLCRDARLALQSLR